MDFQLKAEEKAGEEGSIDGLRQRLNDVFACLDDTTAVMPFVSSEPETGSLAHRQPPAGASVQPASYTAARSSVLHSRQPVPAHLKSTAYQHYSLDDVTSGFAAL